MISIKKYIFFLLLLSNNIYSAQLNNSVYRSLKDKLIFVNDHNNDLKQLLEIIKKDYFQEKKDSNEYLAIDVIDDIFLSIFESLKIINTSVLNYLNKKYKKNGIKVVNNNISKQAENISTNLSSYIFLQTSFKSELYKVKYCNEIIPFFDENFFSDSEQNKYIINYIDNIDELFSNFDNYVFYLLDILEFIIDNKILNLKDFEKKLIVNIDDKLIDQQTVFYKLKKNKKDVTHLILEKTKYSEKYFMLTGRVIDDNFFWYASLNDDFSKIYIDKKPAPNGILFLFLKNFIEFYFYIKDSSFPERKSWLSLKFNESSESLVIKANKRIKATDYGKKSTKLLFIDFDNIVSLKKVIKELMDNDFLNTNSFISIID